MTFIGTLARFYSRQITVKLSYGVLQRDRQIYMLLPADDFNVKRSISQHFPILSDSIHVNREWCHLLNVVKPFHTVSAPTLPHMLLPHSPHASHEAPTCKAQ